MDWYKPEYMGTFADWVSGLLTAVGIAWAIYETRRRSATFYSFSVYVRKKTGELIVTYTNKSDIEAEVQQYGYRTYASRFSKEVLDVHAETFDPMKITPLILKPNKLQPLESPIYNPRYIYGQERDYLWIEPFILDMTGIYKVSRKRYKIKMDDLEKFDPFPKKEKASSNEDATARK